MLDILPNWLPPPCKAPEKISESVIELKRTKVNSQASFAVIHSNDAPLREELPEKDVDR